MRSFLRMSGNLRSPRSHAKRTPGMANSDTTVKLGLAAGKVYQKKSEPPMTQSNLMKEFLEKNDFVFWSPEDIRKKVKALSERAYENDPAIITAKILFPELTR